MEPQKPVIAKAIRRKNKARDIPLPNSKLLQRWVLSSSDGKESASNAGDPV